jgi:hypothetical protein
VTQKRQRLKRVSSGWVQVKAVIAGCSSLVYLISPDLLPHLPGEAVIKLLVTTVTCHGAVLLWPIKLPNERGWLDEWNKTALEASKLAMTTWIRLVPEKSAGNYTVLEALNAFPEPRWPDLSLEQLLELAFKDRFIDSMDHAVLRRLRGEFA